MAGQHITRIVAASGVAYGSPRRAAAWGTAKFPLLPRHGRRFEPPLDVLDHDDAGAVIVADLGTEVWERLGVQ